MSKINKQVYACPLDLTIELISGKWSMWVLFALQSGPLRFGELRKKIPGITEKMLIQQLRKFENYSIVNRKVYTQVPPKVEYSLTEHGESLEPIMVMLNRWALQHSHILENVDLDQQPKSCK